MCDRRSVVWCVVAECQSCGHMAESLLLMLHLRTLDTAHWTLDLRTLDTEHYILDTAQTPSQMDVAQGSGSTSYSGKRKGCSSKCQSQSFNAWWGERGVVHVQYILLLSTLSFGGRSHNALQCSGATAVLRLPRIVR